MGFRKSWPYNVVSLWVYHFPGFMSILPGDVLLSAISAGKNVSCVGCLVCVSIFGEHKVWRGGFVSVCSVCHWFIDVCLCVWVDVGFYFSVSLSVWLCQRLWQVCRFRAAVLLTPWSRSPFSCRHTRPSPQSQRWNSSKPWLPFLRWRVHTWPSVSTGLQMRDQKCLAQQRPSEQSLDLRHASPSWPGDRSRFEICYILRFLKTSCLLCDTRLVSVDR